jgi:peptidoglycan/LPS O-acetylase OafA/YrhL
LATIAVAAVGGFFFLSGFTIRMLSDGRVFDLRRYGIDRLSRLWSVALPALALTAVLDFATYRIAPGYYMAHWADVADHIPFRLGVSALFGNELWGQDVAPLSNAAYWSLSYEAWFYVLYGLALARRPLLALVAVVIAGPNILFLLPLWLAGALGLELLTRADTSRKLAIFAAGCVALAAVLAAGLVVEHGPIQQGFAVIKNAYFGLFGIEPMRVNLLIITSGIFIGLLMLATLSTAKILTARGISVTPGVVRVARRVGDFTFPLYLLHIPLFGFCRALGFYDPHSAWQKVLVFAGVCGVIFIAAPAATTVKLWLRAGLSRLVLRQPARVPAADAAR